MRRRRSRSWTRRATRKYCPADLAFDVSAAALNDAREDDGRITVELRVSAQHESDLSYGRQLNWYKRLQFSVTYNSLPAVDGDHLYNGGFPCREQAPYPALPAQRATLQAVGNDADQAGTVCGSTSVSGRWRSGGTGRTEPGARSVRPDHHGPGAGHRARRRDDVRLAGPDLRRSGHLRLVPELLLHGRPHGTAGRPGHLGQLSEVERRPHPGRRAGGVHLSGGGNPDVVGFAYAWESVPCPGAPTATSGNWSARIR